MKSSTNHNHHPEGQGLDSALATALARLRGARLSVTRRRKEILEILANSSRPLTAREVGERLPDGKDCDPGTICRCLRTFEHAGIVSRLGFGRNKAAVYELRGVFSPQGCLVTKSAISGTELVNGPELEQLSKVIAEVYADLAHRGYTELSHVVQFVARAPKPKNGTGPNGK